MIFVAALILPAVGLLLFGMDRIEEWLSRPATPRTARSARGTAGRHLHLVPRAHRQPEDSRAPEPSDAQQDAA